MESSIVHTTIGINDPANSCSGNRTVLLILNYKNYSDTLNFLQSVLTHEVNDADIVILDNASGNESVMAISQWIEGNFPRQSDDLVGESGFEIDESRFAPHINFEYTKGRVAVFSSDENFGFSGGNNALAHIGRQMGYDYLYLLNSDVLFTDKFAVSKMVALHKREPDAYLSGPCVINRDGGFDTPYNRDNFWGDAFYYGPLNRLRRVLGLPITQFAFAALSKPEGAEVYKVTGAALFFPTERFFELNGFDENVWLSCEEAILGEKVYRCKGKVMYLPTTVLIHIKASAPREKNRKIDILRNHFNQRNYYYRTYRDYSPAQISLIGWGQKLRLLLASRG